MQVRIIRDPQELPALEARWDELIRQSEFQAPFYSWTWYDAWWKHFGQEHELFLIAVEDTQGRLQAVAPLMKGKRSLRGLKVSEISFLANSISPRNSILFRKDFSGPEALATVLACLAQHRGEWDIVRLWNIPETASYLSCSDDAVAAHAFRVLREPGWQSASIALENGFEKYMVDNFGKERRRGIRQKVRQLSSLPGYQVMDFTRPEEMEHALELAFAVSRASWKGKLGTDMAALAARKAFYTDITRRLAPRGQVRIWISSLGETPLALEYSLVSDHATYLIVNDFHELHQRMSPGTVLLHQVVERMFDENLAEFQFSGDIYDYKSKWATGVHRHVTLELFHRGPYSRFLWWTKSTALPALRTVKASLRREPKNGIPRLANAT